MLNPENSNSQETELAERETFRKPHDQPSQLNCLTLDERFTRIWLQ